MAGYSSTPLVKKLGIKEGARVFVKNAPVAYTELTGSLPHGVQLKSRMTNDLDLIHIFTKSRPELDDFLVKAITVIKKNGAIWVSWPKKSSKIPSEVTEDVIREICLPMGLVDIKVCAVDEVWSGLKLVIRKEGR